MINTAVGPLRVLGTRHEAAGLWEWLQRRSRLPLGLDAETNAEDPFSASYQLRLVQMADEHEGWVIQAQRPGMLEVVRACVQVHPYWIAHYAENDLRFVERAAPGSFRLGQREPHLADTQPVLAYYDPRTVTAANKPGIDPRISLSSGLKPAINRILGLDVLSEADKALYARFHELAPTGFRTPNACRKWGFAHISDDDEIYLVYAGLDALCEIRLFNHMRTELKRRGQWPIVSSDLRAQWHIDQMTLRGRLVDPPYVKWLNYRLEEVVEERAVPLATFGILKSGMGPGVGAAFKRLGVQSPKETSNGGESWDTTVLKELAERPDLPGQLASTVTMVRRAGKFRVAYVQPMLDGIERDGRTHTSMRAIGTISGRGSAARPPEQQLPKRDSLFHKGILVRAAYIAPPGWVYVGADLKQGEPRTMAALSQDPNLIHDLLAGDLNNEIAKMTYGSVFDPTQVEDVNTPHYDMRQRGKFGFLSWSYGVGVQKLSNRNMLNVPVEQAAAAKRNWESRYSVLTAYGNKLNRQPHVVLDSGRICPLWDRYYVDATGLHLKPGKMSRLGLNYATQGTQRDLMYAGLHRVIDWGWSWALSTLIHDEILCCVPEHLAEECRRMLIAAMTMTYRGIPIECDAKIHGRTWAKQPAEFDPSDIHDVDESERAGGPIFIGADSG